MLTGPLNLPAPGRRQSVYLNFHVFARTCVFNKQSLPSLLCDHHQPSCCQQLVMVPLLPKLRGHFAEFLNHDSLDRLSILYLTTCVGLGYGPHKNSLEAFLGSIGSLTSPQWLRITSQVHNKRIYQPVTLHAYTRQSTTWHSYLPASPHRLATTRSGPVHPQPSP